MGLNAEAVVRGLRGALFRDTISLRRARADRRRYMNAAKYGLDRVFFSGCFIRGERAIRRALLKKHSCSHIFDADSICADTSL